MHAFREVVHSLDMRVYRELSAASISLVTGIAGVALLLLVAGCGESGTSPDAGPSLPPDVEVCPGMDECGGRCVDLDVDPNHCGECGYACEPGELCSEGACANTCRSGMDECGGRCVDLDVDPNHCGECGYACEPGELCSESACVITCGAGLDACEGSCRDFDVDRSHCGSCGHACAANEACVDGNCAVLWSRPSSCEDIALIDPLAADGSYTLYFQRDANRPYGALCTDLDTLPRTYLPLERTSSGDNVGRYKAGGLADGTDLVTRFTHVRFHPDTGQADPNDYSFSSSTGLIIIPSQGALVTEMPWGSAGDCGGGGTTARVDLRGLPFAVSPEQAWIPAGEDVTGSADRSDFNQVVDVSGVGGCGVYGPADELIELIYCTATPGPEVPGNDIDEDCDGVIASERLL
jgi:hypothetical protein